MSHNQKISELQQIFQKLTVKLEEIDAHAIRNKQQDIDVMTESELNQVLSSNNRANKRRVLFSQIGYLRINLFSEYYERVLKAETQEDFDGAVRLMDDYIKTVASSFIPTKKQAKWLNRIKKFFSIELDPDPVETMKGWNDFYDIWFNTHNIGKSRSNSECLEEYRQAKLTFVTLYRLSFSYANFPPVTQEPAH